LGPRVNAFLFSSYGQKYLKALLEYHIVVNQTLYTDAFYDASKKHDDEDKTADRPGNYHYDLPTVLDDKYLAVDVARWGPFVEIRINAFSRVTIHDGVASDGVIQVVSDVLIPPKSANGEQVMWQGEELRHLLTKTSSCECTEMHWGCEVEGQCGWRLSTCFKGRIISFAAMYDPILMKFTHCC
jgi:hypothetical protein